MLSKNNSSPVVCVNNLIQTARGEVPYDRIKGVSSESLDAPTSRATDEVVDDVEWMLNTYEPRADIESVTVTPTDSSEGHFAITATIKNAKEADA